MEDRQKMMLYGSIAVMSICVIVMIYIFFGSSDPAPTQERPQIDKVYFFDLTTNTLFPGEPHLTPPIPAPNNAKGARAYVYSCGDCSKQWIGWIERYKPKAKALMDNPPVGGYNAAQQTIVTTGLEIRAAKGTDKDWVSPISQAAADLKNKALKGRCPNNKRPILCHPATEG
jgi:hypothetical protein